jgi:hypothetical protein
MRLFDRRPGRRLRGWRVAALAAACLWLGVPSAAQDPPPLLGGRLSVGGEVSATVAPEDEGYFNYSDYEHDTLRLFRVSLAGEFRLAGPLSVLGDVRSDNLDAPRVYALYVRVRPWTAREFDIQVGVVPPVFGAFPRRRYLYDNPLPSLPLAFQYLTTLRSDAIPATAEQLVARRGRGWRVRYPIGSSEAAPGVPLADTERWDTGIQVRLGREPLSLAIAVTQGSLSQPRVDDDNDGKQWSARLAWTPDPVFTAGISGSVGEFLSNGVVEVLPASQRQGRYRQEALGADAEWVRGHWVVRGEAVWSRWHLPALDDTAITDPLQSLGAYGEARYKLRPGLYLAGRVEHLAFSTLASDFGRQTWDAPVTRVEGGAGYTLRRHVLLKGSWQHNWRDGGPVRESDLVAGQLLVWF